MNMKLTLIDQLTLLSLDDKTGSFIPDSTAFSYAIGGAVILELALEEKINIENKRVKVIDSTPTNDKIVEEYFETIKSSTKERKLQTWVERIGSKAHKIKQSTIDKLIDDRILEKKEEKILWVFTIDKYPAQNSMPENRLRARLYDVIINKHNPTAKKVMLLNLIDACQLQKEVFGKENAKLFKQEIKKINEADHLSGEVSKSIKEICDLVNTMMVVMMTTVVTTTIITN